MPSIDPPGHAQSPSKSKPYTAPWVTSTYFAEGFPYAVVNNLVDVLFVELGASLRTIGLTSLLHLPWNLKFLMGPVIDNFGSKRAWIIYLQILLCVGLFIFSGIVSTRSISLTLAILSIIAILSALHDIAIDGYYLEVLDETEQTKWVGFRAPAYRAAMLLAGGGPGLSLMTTVGWPLGLLIFALFFSGILCLHIYILPPSQQAQHRFKQLISKRLLFACFIFSAISVILYFSNINNIISAFWVDMSQLFPDLFWFLQKMGPSGIIVTGLTIGIFVALIKLKSIKTILQKHDNIYSNAFISFLDRPNVGLTLWFVLFFRTGEAFLMKMRFPFLHSIGMDASSYAWAYGTWGLLAGMLAPAIGGWLIAKQGLKRWLWPMVLAQNSLNITFWWLAWYSEYQIPSYTLITSIIVIESFGAGLGTAVFMVYLMRCTDAKHQAAHFALLTALMGTTFTIAGTTSGLLAEQLGFTYYFAFATIATIPGMVVIPWLNEMRKN